MMERERLQPFFKNGVGKKKTRERKFPRLFVIRLGLEPKTHSLEGCCSIQLSYRTSDFPHVSKNRLQS